MCSLVNKKNMQLLGGLDGPDKWSTDLSRENYPPIRDMLE